MARFHAYLDAMTGGDRDAAELVPLIAAKMARGDMRDF